MFFSLSTLQFSLTFATRRRKRIEKSTLNAILDRIFGTSIWAIFIVFLFQDLPFFVWRIILRANYDLTVHFTINFFLVKNAICCFIEITKIAIILYEYDKKASDQGSEARGESVGDYEKTERLQKEKTYVPREVRF